MRKAPVNRRPDTVLHVPGIGKAEQWPSPDRDPKGGDAKRLRESRSDE